MEEVTDSGFLGTTPTLSCSQLGDDALVQVSGRRWLAVKISLTSKTYLKPEKDHGGCLGD